MENISIMETSEDYIIPPTVQSGSPINVIINGEISAGTNSINPGNLGCKSKSNYVEPGYKHSFANKVSSNNMNSQLDLSIDLFDSQPTTSNCYGTNSRNYDNNFGGFKSQAPNNSLGQSATINQIAAPILKPLVTNPH